MWGKRIIDNTLKHIFQHHFHIDRPGGKEWIIKPHKRRNRVISFLRMILSWECGDLIKVNLLRDKDVLMMYFIWYFDKNYNDLFIYKIYEEYEF